MIRSRTPSVTELEVAVRGSWSRDTTVDPNAWSAATPSIGQCAVTALVVQDLLGGDLLRAEAGDVSHYWNALPSGDELDLTRDQFGDDVVLTTVEVRSRTRVLANPETQKRYDALAQSVRAALGIQKP